MENKDRKIQQLQELASKIARGQRALKEAMKMIHGWEEVLGVRKTKRPEKKEELPFDFSAIMKVMGQDKNRHIQIIALYWKYKEIRFYNRDQYQSALKRELRSAQNIKGYSDERILEVMNWLQDETDIGWKMETIHKFIDENLDEIEPLRKKQIKDYR